MTADQMPDAPDDAEVYVPVPVVPLEVAVPVLNAVQRAVRAQQRRGSDARLLARLEQQAARRRAVSEADDDG